MRLPRSAIPLGSVLAIEREVFRAFLLITVTAAAIAAGLPRLVELAAAAFR